MPLVKSVLGLLSCCILRSKTKRNCFIYGKLSFNQSKLELKIKKLKHLFHFVLVEKEICDVPFLKRTKTKSQTQDFSRLRELHITLLEVGRK